MLRILIPGLFTLSLLVTFGQNCFDDYSYHRSYHVAAPAGTGSIEAATHHLLFETSSLVEDGKLRADGHDLRVTDAACNPLSFFIQGITERDTNAIYIALPELDEEGMEVHFYYGNPTESESMSDGEAVFLFFDDFEDGLIDPLKWETIGAYNGYEEVDGELQFTGQYGLGGAFQYVAPVYGSSDPVTFDFVANSNNSRIYGVADTSDIERMAFRYGAGVESNDSLNIIAYMNDTINGGFNPGIVYPDIIVPRVEMNIISFAVEIGDEEELMVTRFMNLSNLDSNLDTLISTQYQYDALRPFFASLTQAIRMEFVGTRATPSALPAVLRNDEVQFTPSSIWEQANKLKSYVFPNPGDGQLHIHTELTHPRWVAVYDTQGRTIDRYPYSAIMDITELDSGLYLLVISDAQGRRSLTQYLKH